jgi:hypothetical protein
MCVVKEKAKELALELGHDNFGGTEGGWLRRFKLRYGIIMRKPAGEAGDVSDGVVDEWRAQLPRALSPYAERDIFNLDETALYWRCMPDRTLAFRGEKCEGGKKPKDRITVLVGASMAGEKLPLLIIGKSAKPRAFKNARIPLPYESNTKAWMTSSIWETVSIRSIKIVIRQIPHSSQMIKGWDKKLETQGRRVLAYIDNCSSHKLLSPPKMIQLVYLPPNTTARLQPCDQGIIQSLKCRYRKNLLRRRLAAMEANRDFRSCFTLLDALHCLKDAWTGVEEEAIQRCFKKAGFLVDGDGSGAEMDVDGSGMATMLETDDAELRELWAELGVPDASLADYLVVDEQVATAGELTLQEIADLVRKGGEEDAEAHSSDSEDTLAERLPATRQEAWDGLLNLRDYVQRNGGCSDLLSAMNRLEDFLHDDRQSKMKQKSITDFFHSA